MKKSEPGRHLLPANRRKKHNRRLQADEGLWVNKPNDDTMTTNKTIQKIPLGSEAPGLKDFIIVLAVVLALIALSWIAWYKFHWLH